MSINIPLPVQQLNKMAEVFFDPSKSLKLYCRSAELLLKQHCVIILDQLEKWRPILQQRYEEYQKRLEEQKKEQQRLEDKVREPPIPEIQRRTSEVERARMFVPTSRPTSYATTYSDSYSAPKITKKPSLQNLAPEGKMPLIEDYPVIATTEPSYKDLTSAYINDVQPTAPPSQQTTSTSDTLTSVPESYSKKPEQTIADHQFNNVSKPMSAPGPGMVAPELPPKPTSSNRSTPPLPPKNFAPVEPDPTCKEEVTLEEKSDATTEGGIPLRTVYVPKFIHDEFVKIASPNTKKNLETCGILCAKLKKNSFFVTTLLIPNQTSTANTVSTTNEEEIFEFQDSNDLMTLGWIHTHPTQSCFMSSVDLHTHCAYQVMLPEAIAIVCAPSQTPSIGYFRLTDPPGLGTITSCRKKEAFHPHPDLPLYTDASGYHGHVREVDDVIRIVDLRK